MSKEAKYNETISKAFSFLKAKNLGEIYLYFDKDFNDYYIVVKNDIYDTEKYNLVIDEFMKNFDISNISVMSEKYIIDTDDLVLIDKYASYKEIKINSYNYVMNSIKQQQHSCISYQIYITKSRINEEIQYKHINCMVA